MSSNASSIDLGERSIMDRLRLDGRAALVTGGGQGIGRAFCHALGEAGAHVLVVDIDEARAESVVTELAAKEVDAFACVANVTQRSAIDWMVSKAVGHWGKARYRREQAALKPFVAEWMPQIPARCMGRSDGLAGCPCLSVQRSIRLHGEAQPGPAAKCRTPTEAECMAAIST